MEKTTICEIIESLSNDNPLKSSSINPVYKDTFIQLSSKLSTVDRGKMETLLCGRSDFNEFKYNQGISELMLYFQLLSSGIIFTPEKKVNPSNARNVDVSAEYKGITYNFEVKSPEYADCNDGRIHGRFANRFGDINENNIEKDNICSQIVEASAQCGEKKVVIDNMTDNKIKSCLLDAQEKFSNPSNAVCNIILISTTTFEMMHYWNYITNTNSGFFNLKSDINQFDNKGKQLTREMYDRVTAIILSNAITLNERHNLQSWDMSHAINIILANPTCQTSSISGLQLLSEFYPHKTCAFSRGLFHFLQTHPSFPEICYLPTFFAEYGYNMNEQRKND